MFQFTPFPFSYTILFMYGYQYSTTSGFPHSDIHGSLNICFSPWLFAAYHVFLRLLVPRHSPYALTSLTYFFLEFSCCSLVCCCYVYIIYFSMCFFKCVYFLLNINKKQSGGDDKNRTRDPLRARQMLQPTELHPHVTHSKINNTSRMFLLRKEVIQPHLPIRLPCYDFTPIIKPTFDHFYMGFGYSQLSWCDGRCVQGPGTYSPQYADL